MSLDTIYSSLAIGNLAKESLPTQLYTANQSRELDRCAIEEYGIPGLILMKRAGRAAFDLIRRRWPQSQRIVIFCGNGNNGGDGYVVAQLASAAGMKVKIYQVGEISKLRGEALTVCQECVQEKISRESFTGQALNGDLIVDGLIGTGLNSELSGDFAAAVIAINNSNIPCLALDIPSGLGADNGIVFGRAVKATCTITFIGCKQGLLTGEGPSYTGDLVFDDLDVPAAIYERVSSSVDRVSLTDVKKLMPKRERHAHKGFFGHVLVVGGDYGMAGAVVMAAEAAIRSGAGLVSVATHQEHVATVVTRMPELMCHAVESDSDIEPLLTKVDVVVIGPGLGSSLWSEELLNAVVKSGLPMVLDADGLNLLSAGKLLGYGQQARNGNWILTPHPSEAARLLGIDKETVQEDRFKTAQALQNLYGGAVILKGAGTIICAGSGEQIVSLAAVGNPGMASGGMGDVLSGIVGALLAQGLSLSSAARLGPFVHGLAADMAASQWGERGLLATDLLPPLRYLLNGFFQVENRAK